MFKRFMLGNPESTGSGIAADVARGIERNTARRSLAIQIRRGANRREQSLQNRREFFIDMPRSELAAKAGISPILLSWNTLSTIPQRSILLCFF
jgi:hypothetical protein